MTTKKTVFSITLLVLLVGVAMGAVDYLGRGNRSDKRSNETVGEPPIDGLSPKRDTDMMQDCPEIQKGRTFSTPPDPTKIVADPQGGVYPVNQIVMDLIDGAMCNDAEELAASVNGKIIGFAPSANLYQLEVPTATIEALDVVIDSLHSDPRVEGAFPNYEFHLQTN